MNTSSLHTQIFPKARSLGATLALALLTACGGGGDSCDDSGFTAKVCSASVGDVRYSQPLTLTIEGARLDQALNVTSAGCTGMTRSTTAPLVSTASIAYYRCTASVLGDSRISVVRARDGTTLATVPFTVPVPQVTLTVSNGAGVAGNMVLTLAPDKTPVTVNNFLNYVNTGFYDGTVFHRVRGDFVIQGGGYLPLAVGATPVQKPTNPPIALEVNKGLSNVQWSVAMARTDVLDSATSQFFINLVDNVLLDTSGGGFAVFATLSTGTTVAAAIAGAPCAPFAGLTTAPECSPNPNVVITSAAQTR